MKLAISILLALFVMSVAADQADARTHRRHHSHHASKQSRHVHHLHHRARHVHHRRAVVRHWAQPVSSFGDSSLVQIARNEIGNGAVYGRRNLWCARFMNYVLARSGHTGTGSDMARSFASYGRRVSEPQVGAIAVMRRGRHGGHVGVISGVDPNGNPIVISGNHGRRVAEAVYSKNRVYAYVLPQ